MKKPGAVDRIGGYKKKTPSTEKKQEPVHRPAIKVSYDNYGQILNYNASHADGSSLFSTFTPKDDLRRFLLGTVTAGAVMVYGGRQAKAACTPLAPVVTCTGDLSAGVTYNVTGVLTTLNVNSLTQDAGAIFANENTGITINVDTGIHAIDTVVNGIDGRSSGGGVTIDSTGDITSDTAIGIVALDGGAGAVNVTNDGAIQSNLEGIYARSLGGGGITIDSTGDITSENNRGIFARDFGAGAVDVSNDGKIQSHYEGIFAESSSGKITIDTKGDITSADSSGIFARSLGSNEVDIKNDGKILSSSTGIRAFSNTGKVTVDSKGDIISGNGLGIFADNAGANEVSVKNDGIIQSSSLGIYAFSFNGKISIDSTGDITSDSSNGIKARSIGTSEIFVKNNGKIQSHFEAIEASSFSGKITIDSKGDLTSNESEGIEVTNGFNGLTTFTNVGDISITNNGTIIAEQGIDARSSDGAITIVTNGDLTTDDEEGIEADNGFDFYGNALTNVGDIAVTFNGSLQAVEDGLDIRTSDGNITIISTGDITSQEEAAIELSSLTGNSDVTINAGTVNGFTYAIDFIGGNNNSLLNKGSLIAQSNLVIRGSTGNETINNEGTITGNVDLGTGLNAFNNKSTGTFRSGMTVNLGGGTLTNEGVLSPGGMNAVQTTALTGNFVQTADGQLVVDIDEGGAGNDQVTITGAANLNGVIAPNVIHLNDPTSGKIQIAEASGGLTLAGLSVLDTDTVDFEVLQEGNQLFLTWTEILNSVLGEISGALTPNQLSTARTIDAILASDGAPPELKEFLKKLIDLGSEQEILAALDQLHSEGYLATLPTTLFSNRIFANAMFSCSQYTSGANAHLDEGQCYWAKVTARQFDQDRTQNNFGINEQGTNFSGGLQFAVQPNWFLGVAASYEDTETDIDHNAVTDGYRAQFGSVLKTRFGSTTFAAGITGGFGNFDTKRFINFGGLNLVAEGDQDINFGSGHVRVAHSFDMGSWYFRPMVDASLTYLELEGLRETGAGVANLTLQDADDWYLSVSPAIEFGGKIKHGSGAIIRPYLRAGVTFFENNDLAITTSFSNAPVGINPFQIGSEFEDVFGTLEVGLNIISDNGLSLKFNYEGHFSEDSESHAGGVKLGVQF